MKIKDLNEVWKQHHIRVLSTARLQMSKEIADHIRDKEHSSNKAKPMTPQELLKIKLMFEALDAEHNRSVSIDEMVRYFPDQSSVFRHADKDGNGVLSFDEFKLHAFPELKNKWKHLDVVFDALIDKKKQLASQHKAHKSGQDKPEKHTIFGAISPRGKEHKEPTHAELNSLNKEEIIRFFEYVTGAHPNASVFDAIDVNKDNKVTREEFKRIMARLLDTHCPKTSQATVSLDEMKSMFDVLDAALQDVYYNSLAVCVLGVEVDAKFLLDICTLMSSGIVASLTVIFPVR